MAHPIKTPRARLDLESIVRHISHDNLEAALRWLQDAERLFELLAEQPQIGKSVMSRRFGPLRRHTMGNYVIYYRSIPDGVQILRGRTWRTRPTAASLGQSTGSTSIRSITRTQCDPFGIPSTSRWTGAAITA